MIIDDAVLAMSCIRVECNVCDDAQIWEAAFDGCDCSRHKACRVIGFSRIERFLLEVAVDRGSTKPTPIAGQDPVEGTDQ